MEELHTFFALNKEHIKVFPNVLVIGFQKGKNLKDYPVRVTLIILDVSGRY